MLHKNDSTCVFYCLLFHAYMYLVFQAFKLHIFDSLFLQKEEAKKLVRDAIAAGIFNDLGSGSNVDVCVITKDKVDYIRPFDEANLKGQR